MTFFVHKMLLFSLMVISLTHLSSSSSGSGVDGGMVAAASAASTALQSSTTLPSSSSLSSSTTSSSTIVQNRTMIQYNDQKTQYHVQVVVSSSTSSSTTSTNGDDVNEQPQQQQQRPYMFTLMLPPVKMGLSLCGNITALLGEAADSSFGDKNDDDIDKNEEEKAEERKKKKKEGFFETFGMVGKDVWTNPPLALLLMNDSNNNACSLQEKVANVQILNEYYLPLEKQILYIIMTTNTIDTQLHGDDENDIIVNNNTNNNTNNSSGYHSSMNTISATMKNDKTNRYYGDIMLMPIEIMESNRTANSSPSSSIHDDDDGDDDDQQQGGRKTIEEENMETFIVASNGVRATITANNKSSFSDNNNNGNVVQDPNMNNYYNTNNNNNEPEPNERVNYYSEKSSVNKTQDEETTTTTNILITTLFVSSQNTDDLQSMLLHIYDVSSGRSNPYLDVLLPGNDDDGGDDDDDGAASLSLRFLLLDDEQLRQYNASKLRKFNTTNQRLWNIINLISFCIGGFATGIIGCYIYQCTLGRRYPGTVNTQQQQPEYPKGQNTLTEEELDLLPTAPYQPDMFNKMFTSSTRASLSDPVEGGGENEIENKTAEELNYDDDIRRLEEGLESIRNNLALQKANATSSNNDPRRRVYSSATTMSFSDDDENDSIISELDEVIKIIATPENNPVDDNSSDDTAVTINERQCGIHQPCSADNDDNAPTCSDTNCPEDNGDFVISNSGVTGTCSICIDDFEINEIVIVLPRCNHIYHKECIRHWLLEKQGCCPLCKVSVIDRTITPITAAVRPEDEESPTGSIPDEHPNNDNNNTSSTNNDTAV